MLFKYTRFFTSPILQLHTAVFLWGFTGVLGRAITLNAWVLVWYRLLITIFILGIWRYYNQQIAFPKVKQLVKLMLVGCIVALHWVLFYGSIKLSNVSVTLTCLAAAGIFTAFLEPIFNKASISIRELFLGCLGLGGIFLIFQFDPSYRWGIITGLGATLTSVIFSLFNKKLVQNVAPRDVVLFELSGGWLLLTALIPFFLHDIKLLRLMPNVNDWVWLLVLSGLCTIVAMELSLRALQHISVFTQNLTLNLEPVYGIILAFVIYHENEHLSKGFYWGLAFIILSVVLQMTHVARNQTRTHEHLHE